MSRDSHLIKPDLAANYPVAAYGKGVYVFDDQGKRYLDGCGGAVTASIGHGVPEILEAMAEQASKVSFVYRSQFSHEKSERLARTLSEITPGDLNWAFFVNSGSEATETAMKVAIQYWQEKGIQGKTKVLSRWMSYHGITMGALSLSGHVLRRKRFVPLLHDFPVAPPPYCYRCPFNSSPDRCGMRCADELETAIHRIGANHIAAFIAEPVIGASGGAIVPPDGYFQRIREICDRHDILLIADEVMTGIGRTGKMFAMDHWGIVPDIAALGKGMTAGYTPMAATLVSDRIIEVIQNGSGAVMSGHTYSANPLSSAVSLAVIDYVRNHNLVQRSEEQGHYLLHGLRGLQKQSSIIGDVRGLGLLCGLEFVQDTKTKAPFQASIGVTAKVIKKAFSLGLIVYSAAGALEGLGGDAIIVAPPMTITKEEIDELIQLLGQAIRETELELAEASEGDSGNGRE